MNETRRARYSVFPLAALLLAMTASMLPAVAHGKDPAPVPTAACDHPCTHVGDCAKFSCECEKDTGSGVAGCDTEAHCCVPPATACERFCEANNQTWTGRFTAEPGRPAPPARSDDARAGSAPAECRETCTAPKDCATISCQCTNGVMKDVAACDAKTHCCGDARVVCEHYCTGKKGKWTGKLAEERPRKDAPSLLDEPAVDDDAEE